MDFPIHTLKSDQGIPIYFERFPDYFSPMSISLAMFCGGADDHALNAPGIHHWGEHIPFRGTVRFPKGSKQIMGRIAELGGRISAYTSHVLTNYYASAPKSAWHEAAEMVIDLAGRPLLRPEDIEAERQIIGQEIAQSNADINRRCMYQLRNALWSGHPFGERVIGTVETLARLRVEDIERMRSCSYGRKRASVFVAGSMPPSEVQERLSELLERLPDNPVSERRVPGDYGKVPKWKPGEPSVERSDFDATHVALVFPLVLDDDPQTTRSVELLEGLLESGALASPLYRIVREERQLAYGASIASLMYNEGGFFACTALVSRKNASAVVDAFHDVLKDPELRSDSRWNYLQQVIRNNREMQLPNPASSIKSMLEDVMEDGRPRTFSQRFEDALSVPKAKVMALLDSFKAEEGRVITLLGK